MGPTGHVVKAESEEVSLWLMVVGRKRCFHRSDGSPSSTYAIKLICYHHHHHLQLLFSSKLSAILELARYVHPYTTPIFFP